MRKEKIKITQEHIDWIKDVCIDKKVYAIPKNGLILALLAQLNLVNTPEEADIIFDDLLDSGGTIEKYITYDKPFVVLFSKNPQWQQSMFDQNGVMILSKENKEGWIEFEWENSLEDDAEKTITRMLEQIGENPNRAGIKETPKRVVKMWKEIFRGYDIEQKPKLTVFDNGEDGVNYDQMIFDTGKFFSHCEHHMVPFFGQYFFAYIPNKKIVGISKVARLVDYHCAKLQIQERLVKDILDDIEKEIEPLGCALIMKGTHLCKVMRGVKKDGEMITSDLRGNFRKQEVRNEFLSFIKF